MEGNTKSIALQVSNKVRIPTNYHIPANVIKQGNKSKIYDFERDTQNSMVNMYRLYNRLMENPRNLQVNV